MGTAAASLFDRLIDLEPFEATEARPLRTYTTAELRDSVRRELLRLLNTRTVSQQGNVRERIPTVIDYGVPDYSAFYPLDGRNQQRLSQAIERSISVFEPRLRSARVEVRTIDGEHQALMLVIRANMVVESINEPVSFPIIIKHRDGLVEVDARDLAPELNNDI